MTDGENGQLPLAKPTVRNRISSERWEQIKTAYAAGIGLREIARKMKIPEGTVLAHAKRHGWTQQIQVATQQQSDAIIPVQSVPQSIASILNERKDRTRLGLSKYTADAAERAAESDGDLRLARNVRDVAAVHSTLWPETPTPGILQIGVLIGDEPILDVQTGEVVSDNEEKRKELPSPVIEENDKVTDEKTAKAIHPAIAEGTPVPTAHREQVIDAQLAPASGIVNSLPPSPGLWRTGWEEPRESAVIFKCRRRRGA